jgi:methionyl-tRNA formyltransferase
MIKKVFIGTSKDIGVECKFWALKNIPNGFEIVEDMDECDIFLSVQYGKILSRDFLKTRKCYNFHPNILPYYGGVGTLSQSILNGEEYSGITLHEIDSGIDTGKIIEIVKIKIDEDETAYTLHLKTTEALYKMFQRTFVGLLKEKFQSKKQSDVGRKVYTYKQLDELFDLSRFMRATYYPGKSKPFFYNKDDKKIEISYEDNS